MINKPLEISRREFLKYAIGSAVALAFPVPVFAKSKEQESLDKMLEEYPSDYIERVIYDPDRSKIVDHHTKYFRTQLHDDEFIKREYELGALDGEIAGIDEFLQARKTPSDKKKFIKKLLASYVKAFKSYIKIVNAMTVFYSEYMSGDPSLVFFFKEVFVDKEIDSIYGKIRPPIENKIKNVFIHERFHAKKSARGFYVGDGILSKEDYYYMNPQLANFLEEIDVLINTYEFFKKDEDEYGQLLSMGSLGYYSNKFGPLMYYNILLGVFTEKEVKLYDKQTARFNKILVNLRPNWNRLYKKLSVPDR